MFLDGLLILVLSFLPMLVYALVLWWLDRYEKEPWVLLAVAFVWGAVPSVILALILQIVLDIPVMAISGSNQLTYDLLGASVVAPLTEEAVKALALLALLLLLRREIDSPIDGVIYGGIVGFGFAAVENVFYLFGAYSESGIGGVFGLAFLRAGVFGLNHAMYTGFTGLGVALALEVDRKLLKPVPVLVGFAVAVGVHALHNALATLSSYGGTAALFVAVATDWLGVLILLLVAGITFWLERRRIVAYGEKLVQEGVIQAGEIETLKSTFRRRVARLSALFSGDLRKWQSRRRYHQKVTEAAFAWHRAKNGDAWAQDRLKRLEDEAASLRHELALEVS
ncbi:MAG: PrsW family intramembrane metalloprotease [Anaerolineae bacterium]